MKLVNRVDPSRTGFMDVSAFETCIFALMKVKKPCDIPQKMLRRFWREASSGSSQAAKVKVSGIQSDKVGEETIREAFSQFGQVRGVEMAHDKKEGVRGFVLTLESLEAAKRAVDSVG